MVYIIHFEKPLSHARHYVGYTENIDARIEKHLHKHGSPLITAVLAAGIKISVVKVIRSGDRTLERKIKDSGNVPRDHCPVCRYERGISRIKPENIVYIDRSTDLSSIGFFRDERPLVTAAREAV